MEVETWGVIQLLWAVCYLSLLIGLNNKILESKVFRCIAFSIGGFLLCFITSQIIRQYTYPLYLFK